MSKRYILHLLKAPENVSPSDVDMACDAGWTTVVPYVQVETDEVTALVQDAIASHGSRGVKLTGIFIGGRDVNSAMDMLKPALPADADVVFGTAKARLQVVSTDQLRHAAGPKIAGDLNAVPPMGVEGVELADDGKPIEDMQGVVEIGALAVGKAKYQVQQALFKDMAGTPKPVYPDFQQAFEKGPRVCGARLASC